MSNKSNSREAILDTASRLFFTQGYHATGLNQIIKDSDTPKGSLYHYFPNGKEQLALTCINRTSDAVTQKLRCELDNNRTTADALVAFVLGMAMDGVNSSFKGIVPFSSWVAVETSCISEDLRNTCQSVFMEWQGDITASLVKEGAEPESAEVKASAVISLFEGALHQAMTFRNEQPLLAAARVIPAVLS